MFIQREKKSASQKNPNTGRCNIIATQERKTNKKTSTRKMQVIKDHVQNAPRNMATLQEHLGKEQRNMSAGAERNTKATAAIFKKE